MKHWKTFCSERPDLYKHSELCREGGRLKHGPTSQISVSDDDISLAGGRKGSGGDDLICSLVFSIFYNVTHSNCVINF